MIVTQAPDIIDVSPTAKKSIGISVFSVLADLNLGVDDCRVRATAIRRVPQLRFTPLAPWTATWKK